MPKILIIDDEKIVTDALKTVLTGKGYAVATAADGMSGIEIFRQFKPDIVILDRDMPKMTGSEVFKRIKIESPDSKILILTGYADPEGGEKYMKLGADAFLSKENGIEILFTAIEAALKTSGHAVCPASGKQPSAGDGKRIRILVADDDESIRGVLKRFLEQKNYEVITVCDGKQAVEQFKKFKPAMTLLDISMPVMNGLETLKKILELDSKAAVAMITANGELETARMCMQLGAYDYIAKPFNFDYLETSVSAKILLLLK